MNIHEAINTNYLSSDQIEEKLKSSFAAWSLWRESNIQERVLFLTNLAEGIRRNQAELANIINKEMGKTHTEAHAEIEKCAISCDFFSQQIPHWLKTENVELKAGKAAIVKDSKGPILTIMPWNFPLWQVVRFAAPVIAGGNVVCLKHADLVSETASMIERIFQSACKNSNLLVNFPISHGQTATMIADPRIRGITFTGSTNGGRAVAELAGRNLKKVVLELGGSDAYVVMQDADIEKAAALCAQAKLINSGQSCVAGKRFVVHEKIADRFIDFFKSELEKSIDSPLASPRLRDQLQAQVEEILKQGAKELWRKKNVPKQGAHFPPMIIEVDKGNQVAQKEEFFGPVALLIRGSDDKELLQIANSSDYGLGGAIFSQDIDKAWAFALKMECGLVAINNFIKSDAQLPFGGVKNSGFGRELSLYGFLEFLNLKSVLL